MFSLPAACSLIAIVDPLVQSKEPVKTLKTPAAWLKLLVFFTLPLL